MKERFAILAAFGVFGLIVLPAAIAVHAHLYADGAVYFAQIVEAQALGPFHSSRAMNALMRRLPLLAAMKCGVQDLEILSWIQGASLFYLPLFTHALAAWIFLRAGKLAHAALVALLYALLAHFTSFFIISESHLGAGLFVLTLAVLDACDPRRRRTIAALGTLWLVSLLVYEFWAIYYPLCLAVLASRREIFRITRWRRAYAALGAGYVIGAAFSIWLIISTAVPGNRGSMLSGHLALVWREVLIASGFYILAIACARRSSHRGQLWLGGAAIAAFAALASLGSRPWVSYELRLLNLLLPMIFAIFLAIPARGQWQWSGPFSRRPILILLAGTVLLAGGTRLIHLRGWSAFAARQVASAQGHVGYVPYGEALGGQPPYGWHWTYPTMSLLLQSFEGVPVRSLLYNPYHDAAEPFGPGDKDHVLRFCQITGTQIDWRLRRHFDQPEDVGAGEI